MRRSPWKDLEVPIRGRLTAGMAAAHRDSVALRWKVLQEVLADVAVKAARHQQKSEQED